MVTKKDIVQIYQHVSRCIDDRPYWHFAMTSRYDKMIDNFIANLYQEYSDKSIGRRFIVHYFAYQYLRWFEKNDTQFGKTIMLSWLIGPKAFERFKNRSEGWSFIVRQKILTPYNISIETIFPPITKTHDTSALYENEEQIKERFRLDQNRLGYCIEHTTLHNKKSKWCVTCCYKKDCKEALKSIYPSIYIQRGYAVKN